MSVSKMRAKAAFVESQDRVRMVAVEESKVGDDDDYHMKGWKID